MLSDDYFDDVIAWRRTLGRQPKSLGRISQRVATEIVHLTYTRITVLPEAREWNISEIVEAILALVSTFLANAPTDRVASLWSTQPTTLYVFDTTPAATNAFTRVNTPSVNQTYSASAGKSEDGTSK